MLHLNYKPVDFVYALSSSSGSQLRQLLKPALTVGLIFALSACSLNSDAAPQSELSDANIAAIVVGANNIDISAAKIALTHSNNKDVIQFARTMITDHNSVLSSAVALANKLELTPVDNDLVATLAEQSRKHEEKLRSLTGKAFDRAYIEHEVEYHRAVIGVIETQLIPGARNKELKSLLASVLPAFRAHLQHCEQIQKQLS